MKASEATWIAMACAASSARPISPIKNTAALNTETSSSQITAIGSPSAQTAR